MSAVAELRVGCVWISAAVGVCSGCLYMCGYRCVCKLPVSVCSGIIDIAAMCSWSLYTCGSRRALGLFVRVWF